MFILIAFSMLLNVLSHNSIFPTISLMDNDVASKAFRSEIN